MNASMSLVLLLSSSLALAQIKTLVSPIDFQDESISETLVHTISQLGWDGRAITIRSDNPYLIRIDEQGRFLGTLAAREGDTVYRTPVSFSHWGDQTAIVNKKGHVFIFSGDDLKTTRHTDLFDGKAAYPFANTGAFAFDGERVVLPAIPESGKATVALDLSSGRARGMGMRPRLDVPRPLWGMAARLWATDGRRFYSLDKFKPILGVWDRRLDPVAEHVLGSDEIDECERRLYEPTKDEQQRSRAIPPHFSDMTVRNGLVYTLCRGALLVIDPEKGEILERYHFFGEGEDFRETDPNRRLFFLAFTLLDDNRVVLAHPGLMWNHDLWSARLTGPTTTRVHKESP